MCYSKGVGSWLDSYNRIIISGVPGLANYQSRYNGIKLLSPTYKGLRN